MKNALLLELAERWEVEALNDSDPIRTGALRECADAVKMLVSVDKSEEQVEEYIDVLRSANNIAKRKGDDVAWNRFGRRIDNLGIGYITPKTFRNSAQFPDN